jgi:hypothetical protein
MAHEASRASTLALHKALEEAHSLLSETPDSLFEEAARLTGGAADMLLSPKTGERSSSSEDLGARTKQTLTKTTTALYLSKTVVELGDRMETYLAFRLFHIIMDFESYYNLLCLKRSRTSSEIYIDSRSFQPSFRFVLYSFLHSNRK